VEGMLYSKIYIPTVKDAMPETEALNFRLLHKAGFVRRNSAGIFSYLPLGNMLLQRLKSLFGRKLEELGCYEVHLPSSVYMEDFYSNIISNRISYKELPIGAWHTKTYLNESIRPRLGLLQSKAWDTIEGFKLVENLETLKLKHQEAIEAFGDLYHSLNVDSVVVEQLSWQCCGQFDKLFFHTYNNGEDTVASCQGCGKLTTVDSVDCEIKAQYEEIPKELKLEYTPGVKTIAEVADYLKVDARNIVKTLIYKADEKLYGVLIRGDRELSEAKLKKTLNCHSLRAANEKEVFEATNAEVGFAGPIGLQAEIICDYEVASMKNVIVGANKTDYHYSNAINGRDFEASIFADLRNCTVEDKCPLCGGNIVLAKGFILGKVRMLGDQYTAKQELSFINSQNGFDSIYIMDFELNINRILAVVAEKNNDKAGLILPKSLAPFDIVIMAVHNDNEAQTSTALQIYNTLKALNYNVLLDDRADRVSIKFTDSELIGVPLRITVGRKISEGIVELKYRNKEMQEACINDILELLVDYEVEHAETI
jgi:prolyl-tRNA synthetase